MGKITIKCSNRNCPVNVIGITLDDSIPTPKVCYLCGSDYFVETKKRWPATVAEENLPLWLAEVEMLAEIVKKRIVAAAVANGNRISLQNLQIITLGNDITVEELDLLLQFCAENGIHVYDETENAAGTDTETTDSAEMMEPEEMDLDSLKTLANTDGLDISGSLQVMSSRETELLAYRFGLNGEEKHTLNETADKFRLTRERVKQIERKFLRRCGVQDPRRGKRLRDYLG